MLEFEKLTEDVEKMGLRAIEHQKERKAQIDSIFAKMRKYATSWGFIHECLDKALMQVDHKVYRAARPIATDPTALDQGVPPPPVPAQATIMATDGSQIVPSRHDPFLYYLINIGGMVYFHGQDKAPFPFTVPSLVDMQGSNPFDVTNAIVSARRDRAEIEILAEAVEEYKDEIRPLLAIVDQRLLYWPVGGLDVERDVVLNAWQESMTRIREQGSLLVGYIDRPGKSSVLNLLRTLDIDRPDFDMESITSNRSDLTDAFLYERILKPGERSKVFADVSWHNEIFQENAAPNEVCFFYLNPGKTGKQIARVDIPRWVADDPEAVATVHALIYDQCQLIGDYPYIIARADEAAVVGRLDQQELNHWISLIMQKHGLADANMTAKQASKDIARGGRTRME